MVKRIQLPDIILTFFSILTQKSPASRVFEAGLVYTYLALFFNSSFAIEANNQYRQEYQIG